MNLLRSMRALIYLKKVTNFNQKIKPMKKLLSILSICLIFYSCSPDRVLYDEIIKKGEILYFEGKPFTGVGFDIHYNRQLKSEGNYKDGKRDGLYQEWYENGQLLSEANYKDGQLVGLYQEWYENGEKLKSGFSQFRRPSGF